MVCGIRPIYPPGGPKRPTNCLFSVCSVISVVNRLYFVSIASRYFSASSAAMQPVPAEVQAWR